MAQFNYKVVRKDDKQFAELASKQMGGGGSSPFKEGAEFVPNGNWDIAISEKNNCYVLINGTVSGIDCILWLSTLLKTGVAVEGDKTREIKPAGLNQQAVTANIGGMSCQQAAEWFFSAVKKDNGYKVLKVTRLSFKTIKDGKEAVTALCQFNVLD